MPPAVTSSRRAAPGAVVIGGRLPALSAVRSLGRQGVRVAVVATNAVHIAQYSRWAGEGHQLLEFQQRPDRLLELLEGKRKHWEGWALFATDDQALEALSRNRDSLEKSYRVVAPPHEVSQQLLRKDLLHEVARDLGVEIPEIYGYASPPLLDDAEIRYPVVVKPVESYRFLERFGKKLFIAGDRDELRRHIETLEAAGLEAQVIDLIPGPDTQFYNYSLYLDRRGEVLAELGMHKLRKSPPFFGVCRVAEVAEAAALREPTLRILKRIGWWGMANAEFKLDPRDGRFRLMEINGRCFLMQGLAMAAGIDYPGIAWREAVLGERSRVKARDWDGVWVNAIDDLYHMLMFRRLEGLTLRRYLAPWRRPKAFAIWSREDWKPFAMHFVFGLRKAAHMAFDRGYREEVTGRVQSLDAGGTRSIST